MLSFVKSVFYKKRSAGLALIAFVLAGSVLLSGNLVSSHSTAPNVENSDQTFAEFKDNPASLLSKQNSVQRASRPFVGAVNGEAFLFDENLLGSRNVPLKTSFPVFKAFGLSADNQKLLYTSLKRGAPSGELYLEDLRTGKAVKVTSRLVLSAAFSPVDDKQIAFTFSGGEKFGLAVKELDSKRERILVSENVFTENFQWDDSGKGIHYFETAIEASTLSLTAQYVSLDSSFSPEIFLPTVPNGFPVLSGKNRSLLDIQKSDDEESDDKAFAFQTSAPDGVHEIFGNNLLGPTRLFVRYNSSGKTKVLGDGQFVKVLPTGVVLKQFSREGTLLSFVDWNGNASPLGITTVNYNLPVSNSTMVQGGTGYSAPGNCNITAHSGAMEFAYDFQNLTVGAHALATADGLVVYTESSVTCNTVDTDSCPDYNAGGCPGSLFGNIVIIQHADGTFSKYAHMQANSPQAVVGTTVNQGLYIGRQGHTGSTSGTFNGCGDHVHFQRQSSPDIFGQSIAVDFADVVSEPLACGMNYVSASTEISHSISPSSQNFGITGGNGSVNVTSTGGTWQATSNDSWITVTSAASGSGNGTVTYTIADNSAGSPRTGTINIGGHLFTVNQNGVQPPNQAPTANAGADQTITLPNSANLNGTANDDGLPNPPATLTTTWSKVSGPGTVAFGNPNSLNTTANFSLAGIYILRLTANDGGLSATDDLKVIVNTSSGGGLLSGSQTLPPSSTNLSTQGTIDWAHWGLNTATDFNHKNGVTQEISNYTQIGSTTPLRYNNNPNSYSWTGGTPAASASGTTTGIYTYELENGFQITVPADTTPRTLKLYVGLWSAGGRLEASLSDGSASPYIDTSLNSTGVLNGVYTLNYQAASNGQTLTLKWIVNSTANGVGNITLQAATLTNYVPPVNQAPTVNAGSDQTITLPNTASLSGTATDDGLPNPPAALTTAWSKVSGPGTVAFGDANSLNTTATFSTNGTYVLRLTADDGALSTTDDVSVTVNNQTSGGVLSATSNNTPTSTNLSTEGTVDWAHWGLTTPSSFNHKSGVTSQISNYTKLGSGGSVERYANNPNFYSWTSGTPTASTTNTPTGVYIIGLNRGFQVTVPADTTQRTLKMYVGLWAAGGRFEASLSDGSATTYVDTSLVNSSGTSNRVYTLNYQAASAGQTLTVKWTVNQTFNNWSNVTLQAATLVDGSGTPPNTSGEFQISSSVDSAQFSSHIATDPNGNSVVVWQSSNQDGSGWGIYARRYNAAGIPQGSEFQVNTYTAGNQFVPRVAMDANGNFAVVWESSGVDGNGYGISCQMFNAAGFQLGSEFQVNTTIANNQHDPFIAMTPTGNFVIVWVSDLQDGSLNGIYGQRFDAAGNPQGGEFPVNTYTNDDQKQPSVSIDANGNFAVAYESNGQDGSGRGVYIRRFNAAGVPQGNEVQVNTFTTGDQSDAWINMTPNGDFVVVWSSAGQDGGGGGIYGQRFNAAGVPQGSEFRVNSYTTNDQVYPSTAIEANGDFVIVWESVGQDGSGSGIFGQRYGANGNPQGGEFQINTFTTNNQFNSYVVKYPTGNFIVVWTSFGQDGSGEGVYGQRFTSSGSLQGGSLFFDIPNTRLPETPNKPDDLFFSPF